MRQKNRIVWKLNSVVIAIASVMIALSTVAEYFIGASPSFAAHRSLYTLLLVVLVIVASTILLRVLMRRLLEEPIDELIAGARRIGEGDLAFRFAPQRDDEIGEIEQAIDRMTGKIREHQEDVHDALEYLEGIIEGSADIIITVTPFGLIARFNRGAEQALGYRREEIQGKHVETLFARQEDRKKALSLLEHGDNVRNFATDLITKSGEVRNVLLTVTRLRDREGNPIGTFGIAKDITEERRLLRQVIQAKKFAAIGQAVTGIQHAVKNMLNALQGGAYLVKSGMRNNKRKRLREGWAMVEEGIDRISSLSRSLLNYVKEWRPEYEQVDVGALAGKVRDVVKQSAADKGIKVSADVAAGLPIVACDSKLIHMALMDIVSNAIDACQWKDYLGGEAPEVRMRVHADEEGKLCTIEVSDNGCGMSEEIRRNIFTPFFSTKKKWGTGLGLALTVRVIDMHGGTIAVDSEPDKGATFRVVLPVQRPDEGKEVIDGQESPDHR
ncbi:MAG: PAS domain S-box protein [Planctomycetes bacterium]|nr:PAS domain S-box protein [Planctomycetota bacterium]